MLSERQTASGRILVSTRFSVWVSGPPADAGLAGTRPLYKTTAPPGTARHRSTRQHRALRILRLPGQLWEEVGAEHCAVSLTGLLTGPEANRKNCRCRGPCLVPRRRSLPLPQRGAESQDPPCQTFSRQESPEAQPQVSCKLQACLRALVRHRVVDGDTDISIQPGRQGVVLSPGPCILGPA